MKNRRKSNLFGCLHEFRQFFFITLLSVLSVNLYAQQRGIQGVVVDGNGETIIGANVLSEDGKAGVITDLDGNFTLNNVTGKKLQVSYIGYQNQVVDINNRSNIKITMYEDNKTLGEVVVVGYGTQKKANLTGAVSSVSVEDMGDRPITNSSTLLQILQNFQRRT